MKQIQCGWLKQKPPKGSHWYNSPLKDLGGFWCKYENFVDVWCKYPLNVRHNTPQCDRLHVFIHSHKKDDEKCDNIKLTKSNVLACTLNTGVHRMLRGWTWSSFLYLGRIYMPVEDPKVRRTYLQIRSRWGRPSSSSLSGAKGEKLLNISWWILL